MTQLKSFNQTEGARLGRAARLGAVVGPPAPPAHQQGLTDAHLHGVQRQDDLVDQVAVREVLRDVRRGAPVPDDGWRGLVVGLGDDHQDGGRRPVGEQCTHQSGDDGATVRGRRQVDPGGEPDTPARRPAQADQHQRLVRREAEQVRQRER